MADPPPEWNAYEPRRDETRVVGPTPEPSSPYPEGGAFATYDAPIERRRVRRRVGLLLASAVVVVGGVGAGLWAIVTATSGDDDQTTTTTYTRIESESEVKVEQHTTGGADLFSAAGMTDLAAALREETGSTRVFEVAVFRNIAYVTVPDADAPDGARVYLWDGTLTSVSETMSVRKAFDLVDLDGDVLGRLCGDDLDGCTVLAGRPLSSDGGVWLTVDGSNGSKRTDLQGNPV